MSEHKEDQMFHYMRLCTLLAALGCIFVPQAFAKDVVFYKLGRLPDYSGILIRSGQMFAVFSSTKMDDPSTYEQFGKMLKVTGAKQSCVTTKNSEFDIIWNTKACASVNQTKSGRFVIKIVMQYDYPNLSVKDKDVLQIYKDYDMVRERRYDIDFSFSGSTCSAAMINRSYVPLDGKNQIRSTVGDLGCAVKKSTTE